MHRIEDMCRKSSQQAWQKRHMRNCKSWRRNEERVRSALKSYGPGNVRGTCSEHPVASAPRSLRTLVIQCDCPTPPRPPLTLLQIFGLTEVLWQTGPSRTPSFHVKWEAQEIGEFFRGRLLP